MNIKFLKSIEQGKYRITIQIERFNESEIEKINKFGSPIINISPTRVYNDGKWTDLIPLTSMSRSYIFDTEQSALDFDRKVKDEIKKAIEQLKLIKDEFTNEENLEI